MSLAAYLRGFAIACLFGSFANFAQAQDTAGASGSGGLAAINAMTPQQLKEKAGPPAPVASLTPDKSPSEGVEKEKAPLVENVPATTALAAPASHLSQESAKTAPPVSSPTKPRPVALSLRPQLDTKRMGDWRQYYEEWANLLVPGQKYLLQFEDEDAYLHVGLPTKSAGSLVTEFSKNDIEKFKQAVSTILAYRLMMRTHCQSPSSQGLAAALDRLAAANVAFHRRALPLSANISENNNWLILLIDRTTLVDATVLISRYLQFKRQRFKDAMAQFQQSDSLLVKSLSTVASLLKTEVSDEDWNKPYGIREPAIETVSLWPRAPIYVMAEQLADVRERFCAIDPGSLTGQNGPKP